VHETKESSRGIFQTTEQTDREAARMLADTLIE
jgi:hypothetical protein